MISFKDLSNEEPYIEFKSIYDKAKLLNQNALDAMVVSSYEQINKEVDSRFVNLKYVYKNKWVFFTNYMSPKATQFKSHDQVSVIFYWQATNTQIRIKANIQKTSSELSDKHFNSRSNNKNALAISSNQSKKIDSYNDVISRYKQTLDNANLLKKRPSNWGGYEFTPYYFEFWEGADFRLNKRKCYEYIDNNWVTSYLQP